MMFSKILAGEVVEDDDCVNPGLVLTSAWIKTAKQPTAVGGGDWQGHPQGVADGRAPIKRLGTPEDFAHFFDFPCVDKATHRSTPPVSSTAECSRPSKTETFARPVFEICADRTTRWTRKARGAARQGPPRADPAFGLPSAHARTARRLRPSRRKASMTGGRATRATTTTGVPRTWFGA